MHIKGVPTAKPRGPNTNQPGDDLDPPPQKPVTAAVAAASMDSTVDAMAAAYEALVDAASAALREPLPHRAAALQELQRCLDAFNESCNRAEDLVQAAAATLDFSPAAATTLDALCRTVHGMEQDVQAAAHDGDEEEVQDEKGAVPSPPAAPVAVAADEN